ncbi:MAG: cupin domain-containing protein [Frankiaceae bacterium]|nr:cupin domain-containing protein [Frankiaceae bacterium]
MTESLTALANRLLDEARLADSGRAAHTPVGGSGHVLRQTVIALRSGEELGEHSSPGEATVLVLRGAVELCSGPDVESGTEGDLMVVPPCAHSLRANQDSVVLLTVVKLK